MFSLQQSQRTRGWNRFCPEAGGGGNEKKIEMWPAISHGFFNISLVSISGCKVLHICYNINNKYIMKFKNKNKML
jgi:hypothetical protein